MRDKLCSEKEKWETVRRSTDTTALQAFMDEFPDGTFATEARQRISRLEKCDDPPRAGMPWPGMLFLVLLAPFEVGLAILFDANHWDFVGRAHAPHIGAVQTALFVSLALAVISAVLLIHRRRAIVSGVEIGLYWLGCAASFLLACFSLFVFAGVLAGAFFIVISAVSMVLWRGASPSSAEAGLYWLGCTAASFYGLAECAYIIETPWGFGSSWMSWPYNYYIACIAALVIAAITAAALVWWRKETDRYWLASTLLAMAAALGVTWVSGHYAPDFLGFLPLIVLISALILTIRERTAKNASTQLAARATLGSQ
jgi:hypothetical protein